MKHKALFEELLHAPQLLKKNPRKFWTKFNLPSHYLAQGQWMKKLPPMLREYSKHLQQAQKFSVSGFHGQLTDDEFNEVITDIEPFLPYKLTLLEYELGESVLYLLIKEWEKEEEEDEETYFSLVASSYNLKDNFWVFDLCPYWYRVLGKNTVELWPPKTSFMSRLFGREKRLTSKRWNPVTESYDETDDGSFYYNFTIPDEYPFRSMMDLEVDENRNYTNTYLNGWFNTMVTAHMILCVLLQYPSLTHETNVTGKKPAIYPLDKRTSYSTMNARPAWEHKVLEIDLYGDKEASANGVATGGSPKAFHSVRKHLRRLPTGKKIFVKAHFRGSRHIGVINKEYKFKEKKSA